MGLEFQLDLKSGVPYYRQIIDHVKSAMTTQNLRPGERLPTVRQLAVDLAVNPNTVSRAYRDLELTGIVETQMGTGTFASHKAIDEGDLERGKLLNQLCREFLSKASTHGFTMNDILKNLEQRNNR